jgi:hypothetical protein
MELEYVLKEHPSRVHRSNINDKKKNISFTLNSGCVILDYLLEKDV